MYPRQSRALPLPDRPHTGGTQLRTSRAPAGVARRRSNGDDPPLATRLPFILINAGNTRTLHASHKILHSSPRVELLPAHVTPASLLATRPHRHRSVASPTRRPR